jgi:hypothetical protein
VEGFELELGAEGQPRAVGEQVAHRGPLCPVGPAQLRDVRGDRVVQGQPASLGEPDDRRRHHRLGQRPHRKARVGGHRLARGRVRDAAVGGGHLRVVEHADRGAWDRVDRHLLAEQARQVEVAHPLTLERHPTQHLGVA